MPFASINTPKSQKLSASEMTADSNDSPPSDSLPLPIEHESPFPDDDDDDDDDLEEDMGNDDDDDDGDDIINEDNYDDDNSLPNSPQDNDNDIDDDNDNDEYDDNSFLEPEPESNSEPKTVTRSSKRKASLNAFETPTPTSMSKSEEKRRSHSRTFQTLHTGSKIKHLKKLDGEPLWRTDIQYDFLAYVFQNTQQVFGNSYEKSTTRYTFADIYIDAMARSSKTSKILCEKLLGDRKAGLNMAMVCLLVNIGRMNTTLNFFPEMRAQLRTYHPIPSLQTYNDQSEYKQLQDAPRLKSILKGACEDRPEPSTLQELEAIKEFPKTNPINLVFLVSTFANKLKSQFFVSPYEFHDLIMNTSLSSPSRGQAFLWLMWAFIETDLSPEQLKNNPFGPGQEDGTRVPEFVVLTPEQLMQENVDPEEEIEFGNNMTRERKIYIDSSQQFPFINSTTSNPPVASGAGPKPKRSSGITPRTVSTPTPTSLEAGTSVFVPILSKQCLEEDTSSSQKPRSPSPSKPRSSVKTPVRQPAKMDPVAYKTQASARETQCQIEVRKMLQILDKKNRERRHKMGGMYREWKRIKDHDPLYDSDIEDFPDQNDTEKQTQKTTENKDDLATLLVHKKRKRHVPPQEHYQNSNMYGAAAIDFGSSNYPDINGITYSGPNNENLMTNSYNFHINNLNTLVSLGYGLTNSHPNTGGNAANTKVATKITVKNRIKYPGNYGEESVSMARAFRRSARWLRRWDMERRMTEQKEIAKIYQERIERDKRLEEREISEYHSLEKEVQKSRERMEMEIEMEFEMAVQEKKDRRSAGNSSYNLGVMKFDEESEQTQGPQNGTGSGKSKGKKASAAAAAAAAAANTNTNTTNSSNTTGRNDQDVDIGAAAAAGEMGNSSGTGEKSDCAPHGQFIVTSESDFRTRGKCVGGTGIRARKPRKSKGSNSNNAGEHDGGDVTVTVPIEPKPPHGNKKVRASGSGGKKKSKSSAAAAASTLMISSQATEVAESRSSGSLPSDTYNGERIAQPQTQMPIIISSGYDGSNSNAQQENESSSGSSSSYQYNIYPSDKINSSIGIGSQEGSSSTSSSSHVQFHHHRIPDSSSFYGSGSRTTEPLSIGVRHDEHGSNNNNNSYGGMRTDGSSSEYSHRRSGTDASKIMSLGNLLDNDGDTSMK